MEKEEIKNYHRKFAYNYYEEPLLVKKYYIELFSVILLILLSVYFLKHDKLKFALESLPNAGLFGDFVGGYVGTVFGLISVILLYFTLKTQRESSNIEKFETRYFELIKLHRENISEMNVGTEYGKKVFVLMIRELRAARNIVVEISGNLNLKYSNEEFFKIAYLAFFYGLGPNSSRMLRQSLSTCSDTFVDSLIETLYERRYDVMVDRKLKFIPFGGHQSRLGHYYRHLYQTVRYVDEKELDIDKYEYIKTIRAQLTNHEQALLFINTLTPLGFDWWDKGLIVKYKMVQNIPEQFFNLSEEIDFTEYFTNDYFEWQISLK